MEPPVTAQPVEDKPSAPWRRPARVIAIVLFFVVGGTAADISGSGGDRHYSSVGDWIGSLLIGDVALLFFLAVIGTVVWLVGRKTHPERAWTAAVLGGVAMSITLILAVLGAMGSAGTHSSSVANATPNPHGTKVQREKAALDAQQWSDGRAPILKTVLVAVNATAGLATSLKQGNTPGVRARVAATERRLMQTERQLQNRPVPQLTDLRQLDIRIETMVKLAVAGYTAYNAALTYNEIDGKQLGDDTIALRNFDTGDRDITHVIALQRSLGNRLRALNAE